MSDYYKQILLVSFTKLAEKIYIQTCVFFCVCFYDESCPGTDNKNDLSTFTAFILMHLIYVVFVEACSSQR